jgi:hypothetical protein
MKGTSFAVVGQVKNTQKLEVFGLKRRKIIDVSIEELKEAWQRPLRW